MIDLILPTVKNQGLQKYEDQNADIKKKAKDDKLAKEEEELRKKEEGIEDQEEEEEEKIDPEVLAQ